MIKTLSHYTDKDRIERLELLVGSGEDIITTGEERTVMAKDGVENGQDFTNLYDALVWATSFNTAGFGWPTLVLDDGIHEIGKVADFNYYWYCYHLIQTKLVLKSASEDASLCTISFSGEDDGELWPYMFATGTGAELEIFNITFNPDALGYMYPETTDAIEVYGPAYINIYDSIFEGFASAIYGYNGTKISLYGNFNDTIFRNCNHAVWLGGTECNINGWQANVSFENCDTGIALWDQGFKSILTVKAGSISFSGNVTDVNIPKYEIQYNGSYYTDYAGPLVFKA